MQRQKEVEDVKEQEKYEEEYFVRLGGRKRRKDSGREMAEKSLEELMDFGGLSNEKVTRVMCVCLCLSVCLSVCLIVLGYWIMILKLFHSKFILKTTFRSRTFFKLKDRNVV